MAVTLDQVIEKLRAEWNNGAPADDILDYNPITIQYPDVSILLIIGLYDRVQALTTELNNLKLTP